jgi:hypothetical protein
MTGQNEFPQGDTFLNKMNPDERFNCKWCNYDFDSDYLRDNHELDCEFNPQNYEDF